MRHALSLATAAAVSLLAAFTTPVGAQTAIPKISQRSFTGGSARVVVTGSFQIDQDVPINTTASFGDGEMTWLQFGVSGSAEPNALLTYQPSEVGITVALGKRLATAGIMIGEKSSCTGKTEVSATAVTGQYTCVDVTSHDPATGKLGRVKIEVRFSAKS
jgi:hypothetical protein